MISYLFSSAMVVALCVLLICLSLQTQDTADMKSLRVLALLTGIGWQGVSRDYFANYDGKRKIG